MVMLSRMHCFVNCGYYYLKTCFSLVLNLSLIDAVMVDDLNNTCISILDLHLSIVLD